MEVWLNHIIQHRRLFFHALLLYQLRQRDVGVSVGQRLGAECPEIGERTGFLMATAPHPGGTLG